jgi:hypothetical protein
VRQSEPAEISDPSSLVILAAWHGRAEPAVDDLTLALALRRARRNQVQGRLARAYPDRLTTEVEAVARSTGRFRHNLNEACGLLAGAGVHPLLVKCDPADDFVYGNFDVVVGDDGWDAAVEALRPWRVRVETHPLERDKLIVHAQHGPAVHLHRNISWFGVVIVEARTLRRSATRIGAEPWLTPAPADAMRVLLAHALFQNLALDLGELHLLRRLLAEGADTDAAYRASVAEGWGGPMLAALALARQAIAALDRGDSVRLPLRLPPRLAVGAGLRHAAHLAPRSPGMALREVALRGPLVIAKARRAARG